MASSQCRRSKDLCPANTVRIMAERPTGKRAKTLASSGGGDSFEVYEQFIPAKFNERTEQTTEFDETSGDVRDFELKSK